jgi:hypothetical protein
MVGWAPADYMRTGLIEDALTMALITRRSGGGVLAV